jgi:hypothetical protein
MTPFLPLSPPTRHRLSAFLVGLLVGMGVVGMLGCEPFDERCADNPTTADACRELCRQHGAVMMDYSFNPGYSSRCLKYNCSCDA